MHVTGATACCRPRTTCTAQTRMHATARAAKERLQRHPGPCRPPGRISRRKQSPQRHGLPRFIAGNAWIQEAPRGNLARVRRSFKSPGGPPIPPIAVPHLAAAGGEACGSHHHDGARPGSAHEHTPCGRRDARLRWHGGAAHGHGPTAGRELARGLHPDVVEDLLARNALSLLRAVYAGLKLHSEKVSIGARVSSLPGSKPAVPPCLPYLDHREASPASVTLARQ
jgi:hypothetical protein